MRWRDFRFEIAGAAALGIIPFVVYFAERALGRLPDQDAWLESGTNHGPWRWEPEGFLIFYPLVLLALIVLVHTLKLAIGDQRKGVATPVAFLVALLCLMAVGQFWFIGWTVD